MVYQQNNYAPICLFTYNRLEETKQTIRVLKENNLAKDSILYIFSDGWKNENAKQAVLEVRNFLDSISGFKEIHIFKSEVNKGLAKSIVSGISKIFEQYETVIVLEDDIITSPNFLDYMNWALDYYKEDHSIQTISGYTPLIKSTEDNFKFNRPFPWGWATWKEYWKIEIFDKEKVKVFLEDNPNVLESFGKVMGEDAPGMLLGTLNNKINSWYILWTLNHFLEERYSLFSKISKTTNIGYGEKGTHCNNVNTYVDNFVIDYNTEFNFCNNLSINRGISLYFSKRYKLIFRLKLIFKKGGLSMLYSEFTNRFLK